MLKTNADSSSVGLELFNFSKLHNSITNIPQTFSSQIGAGNVLDERSKIDARVLLSITIGSYKTSVHDPSDCQKCNLRNEWFTPAE